MNALVMYLTVHHAQITYATGAFFVFLNGLITLLLRLNPNLSDWVTVAEKNPRVAALVRLLGALGIQPVQGLQAFIDFVRGHASPGTLASAKTLQVSSSKPVFSPSPPKEAPPQEPPPPAP